MTRLEALQLAVYWEKRLECVATWRLSKNERQLPDSRRVHRFVEVALRGRAVAAHGERDARFAADYGGYCPLMSVTDLFRRIEKIRQDTPCGPNGCGCDGPVEVRVEFDQTLGYPTIIEQTLRPDLRWRYFDYWVHNRVGGGCTLMGHTDSRIDVDAPVILP